MLSSANYTQRAKCLETTCTYTSIYRLSENVILCKYYRYVISDFSITVFDLITAHTPISAQSRNSVVFRLQPVYFFLYFFTKAYVVGTHLNCIDKSMQFKWVPTTYAFVKKVRKIAQSSLNKPFSDLFYCVSLVDRYIFDHKWVCPVSLEKPKRTVR